jgi:hypothetical protein
VDGGLELQEAEVATRHCRWLARGGQRCREAWRYRDDGQVGCIKQGETMSRE